jgi:photosystem II stability/assembly factor-like uncharacterized protein
MKLLHRSFHRTTPESISNNCQSTNLKRATSRSLPSACCLLPTASRPLPTAHCQLPTAHCSLLTAFCLLLCFSLSAQAQKRWTRQSSGTLAWLHAVFFLDQNRGWVAGSKGVLLKTIDGGKTWQARPKPTDDVLRDVYFADARNGVLVCETNVYELKTKDQPRTYLMTTSDGGETWQRLTIREADMDARLVRAVFSPAGRGWVFGEAGTLFTTLDGQNWKRQQLPTRHLLLGGALVDNDRGWLVGAGSTILQTSDGGETWHAANLSMAQGVRFNATSFVDNRLGWTVGGGGRIFFTANGGRTFQSQNSGVNADLLDVKFVSAAEGWAAGADGIIVHTFDGGLHWTTESSGTNHPLERICFTDRDHGWAVGFGGAIIAYDRGVTPRLRP